MKIEILDSSNDLSAEEYIENKPNLSTGFLTKIINNELWNNKYFPRLEILKAQKKIDGVGPFDNRPSTDELHHFVQFFLWIF